jgi:phage tail sheath protein FI
MPSVLTYPGVYIEEVPSGVRSISGVSTSVTAFAGAAKRGPVNRAVRIQSFADYERSFGGLDQGSEMSYAVRQFFLNGGSDSWVIRLAKGADAAKRNLDGTGGAVGVLTVTARDEGASGNAIQLWVDVDPARPSVFDLTLIYTSADNPADSRSETFNALSMNSQDMRYAVDLVNAGSELVKLTRNVTPAALTALAAATSVSGALVDGGGTLLPVASMVDATHNQLRVSVNGLPPVPVLLDVAAITAAADGLAEICAEIKAQVRAQANGALELSGFDCAVFQTNRIKLTSGKGGEQSTVRVLPGSTNDATAKLKLGAANGGTEADGTAPLVPAVVPAAGNLVGTAIANGVIGPLAPGGAVEVSINGGAFQSVNVAIPGSGSDDVRTAAAAKSLQDAVRALKNDPAFTGFTATSTTGASRAITATAGTRGTGSSVAVRNAPASTLAASLGLVGGTATPGANLLLTGGAEQSFTNDDPAAYGLFIGNRLQRKGIYALDSVDIFNLMCLPGVTDAGILADAVSYCAERRAFFIADARLNSDLPAEMVTDITGTAFPKHANAAVYYPWLRIADPLAGGRLRTVAPCGTVAGVYARTDTNRGIWKAPAGTDAPMLGVQAVTYPLTDAENGQLNPLGVNCIRVLPVYGAVPWGTRTLVGSNAAASEWKYVPVRRLALHIEESLYRGTQWVVFEPNDEPLWGQIRLNVGAFMHGLFRRGAFQGRAPKEAYFVKCDGETTTQADINLGVVNVVVGFMPLKPAEFVVIRIQQMAGQIAT